MTLTQKDKNKVGSEVIDILNFHAGVLKIDKIPKPYLDLAIAMFIEGVGYIHNKEKEEQEKLLKGFSYEK